METLTSSDSASLSTDSDLHLLLEAARGRDFRAEWPHWRKTGAISLAIHAVLIAILLAIPDTPVQPMEERTVIHHITPLYIPSEFTQKAPNHGKVDKNIVLESSASRAHLPSPAPAPKIAPLPPKIAKATPKPVIIEPPRLDPSKLLPEAPLPGPVQLAQVSPAPPPPGPVVNPAPKLSLEDVKPTGPKPGSKPTLAIPDTSVDAAVRNLARNTAPPGDATPGVLSTNSADGRGLRLPELKSDPMGVDFRPYLLQVLQAVRRNWFAVYPAAARQGLRGQVTLQFAVAKDGTVAKIVFATQSGARPLDESAVAAISASNRLPPLPTEFRGDRIVLQMTFQYNMPR